jgi:hypothetical protein
MDSALVNAPQGDMMTTSNLSDVNNISTSRTNLDVYSKAQTDSAVSSAVFNRLITTSNLSDLSNTTTARTNLDVFNKAEVDIIASSVANSAVANRLVTTNNLSDTTNKATSRTNLDVFSKAEVNGSISNAIDAIPDVSAGGGLVSVQTFIASGAWIRPAGIRRILIEVQGGGSHGTGPFENGVNEWIDGEAGKDGGFAKKLVELSPSENSVTVTVGGIMGTSSFGAHVSATGANQAWSGQPVYPGAGVGGDINKNSSHGSGSSVENTGKGGVINGGSGHHGYVNVWEYE